MKIAFSTSGDNLDAPLDTRFGRARKFLVYEMETGGVELIDNAQNVNSPSGAGIQAAETIARSGATALVTGHCGPKAFRVLSAAGVAVYNSDATTVADALEMYRSGKLVPAEAADVEGHWV